MKHKLIKLISVIIIAAFAWQSIAFADGGNLRPRAFAQRQDAELRVVDISVIDDINSALEQITQINFQVDSLFDLFNAEICRTVRNSYQRDPNNLFLNPHLRTFLIMAGDTIFGYAVYNFSGGNSNVEYLAVRPDFKGRGAGSALMKQVFDFALQNRKNTVTVYTPSKNDMGRLFYRRVGRTMARHYREALSREVVPGGKIENIKFTFWLTRRSAFAQKVSGFFRTRLPQGTYRATASSILRPLAAQERKQYEHPLGANPQLERNQESMKAALIRLARWFISKGYPNRRFLELYQPALEHATYSLTEGFTMGKDAATINPHTGLPQVAIGIPALYRGLKGRIESLHDFVMYVTDIPREAKGLAVAALVHPEVGQRIAFAESVISREILRRFESCILDAMAKYPELKNDKGRATIYLLKNLDKYPELAAFLNRNRKSIIALAADIMAGECIEGIETAKALDWAVENGLFDPAQIKLARQRDKQLLSSGAQLDKVLAIELQEVGSSYFDYWLRGDLETVFVHTNIGSITFFLLLEALSFSTSDGREGFNPDNAQIILQGELPQVEEFLSLSSVLLEPVRERIGILEKRIAQMAAPQQEKLIPTRAALLAQVNQVRPIIKQLTAGELNELLDNLFPKRIHPMYLRKPYDMIMIPAALNSLLVSAQIELLLDYYLDMKRTESANTRLESI